MTPNFVEEKKLWKRGCKLVVGLDEAGRGPLAGPVVAAAVTVKISNFSPYEGSPEGRQFLISNKFLINQFPKVNDSKKLSAKERQAFYKILTNHPKIKLGIGKISEKVIDKINIKNAAELAMEKALKNLEKKIGRKADFLIIDGNQLANLKLKTYNLKLIVKGDGKVFSCAAASILAKVIRDRIMEKYHKKYPHYGFDQHKGYPTKLHRTALKKYGLCPIHRKTFSPIQKFDKRNEFMICF